jgi:hypothetical protein
MQRCPAAPKAAPATALSVRFLFAAFINPRLILRLPKV